MSLLTRTLDSQSEHDAAVQAVADIYRQEGKYVWINPGSTKNKAWSGKYIDVIAANGPNPDRAWIVEVETAESVTSEEAKEQWKDYDSVYTTRWHLAVPVDLKENAERLLARYGIMHCALVTWQKGADGLHTFRGLPGLE